MFVPKEGENFLAINQDRCSIERRIIADAKGEIVNYDMVHAKPIDIIAAIRIGMKNAEHRFTKGGCFQLYRVLKQLFPKAEAWYDGNHVVTKIGNAYYDINGAWLESQVLGFYKLENETMLYAKAHDWDFVNAK